MTEWKDADRISDRIIDLANEEVGQGVPPIQVFAGVMLGLMGVLRSAPDQRPIEVTCVETAVHLCLSAMLEGDRHAA